MSRQFAIPKLLSPVDLTALHALMNRMQTLDELHKWMKERGYKVSRSALGNYRAAARDSAAWPLKMKLGILGDAQARGRLRQISAMLDGDDLSRLALFASFLLSCRLASHREAGKRSSGQRDGRNHRRVPTIARKRAA